MTSHGGTMGARRWWPPKEIKLRMHLALAKSTTIAKGQSYRHRRG